MLGSDQGRVLSALLPGTTVPRHRGYPLLKRPATGALLSRLLRNLECLSVEAAREGAASSLHTRTALQKPRRTLARPPSAQCVLGRIPTIWAGGGPQGAAAALFGGNTLRLAPEERGARVGSAHRPAEAAPNARKASQRTMRLRTYSYHLGWRRPPRRRRSSFRFSSALNMGPSPKERELGGFISLLRLP